MSELFLKDLEVIKYTKINTETIIITIADAIWLLNAKNNAMKTNVIL